jgi:CRP-like cAMP-binding protein
MANTDLLKKSPLFTQFTDPELKALSEIARPRTVIAGDTVFDEGSASTSLFLIKSGSLEIRKKTSGDEQTVALLAAGSNFGEMALLDHSARAATVVAKENTELLEIEFAPLEKLIQSNKDIGVKFYRNLASVLSTRIKRTTSDIANLKDLKLRHV